MAEFTEVCRQALRMAKVEGNINKPKYTFMYISATGTDVVTHIGTVAVPPEALEANIMQWAAEHPEPRYPTWWEAWHSLFPDAADASPPCPKHFMDSRRMDEFCPGLKCENCRNLPIPADIAERLGIKPIGVKQADV